MKNAVLEDIKKYAVQRLSQKYGFVGVASGDDMAMLNSTDEQGDDIIIKIEVKAEDEKPAADAGAIPVTAVAPTTPAEPVAEFAEEFIFCLRKQPDGERWPAGTKLYTEVPAGPLTQAQIDHIGEQWDDCMYDAPGMMIDIGASIRAELAKIGGVK